MINSITVKNIKSHKDTTLHLCGGVNVLIGSSQAGKSAFLGAFNWLRNNRPSGIGKKSWFARPGAEMKVEVQTDEGSVSLTKSTRDSRYEVNGETFRKFGSNVPDEVGELLNISDLNIQGQLDQHYLIISGPPEVARVINEVTGLGALDPALNWCTNQINQRNSTVSALEDQLTQRKKDLEAYKDIDVWDGKLVKVEKLFSQYQELTDKTRRLDIVIEEAEEVEQEIEELEVIDFEKCEKLIKEVETKIDELEKLATTRGDIKRSADKLVESKTAAQEAIAALALFRMEYRKQLEQLGKCPLCLTDLKEKDKIKGIMENL